DVQKDLEDTNIGIGKFFFILPDSFKPPVDLCFIDPAVHPLCHYVFIMRTVKSHDLARQRIVFADAPQKVVLELFVSRLAETQGRSSLRVKDRKDRFYCAALARGIHALQHNQDGWRVFSKRTSIRKKQLLQVT